MTKFGTLTYKRRNRGFTLAEIAIVTLILGLMMAGVLGAITNQINQGRVSATQRQLDEIREALLGFAASNGYLPCPDTDGDGVENAPNRGVATLLACTNVEGFLPWVTLGVHQTDAWGMRFRYRIKDEFARASAANSPAVGGITPIAACAVTAGTTDPSPTSDPNNCTFDIQDSGDIQINTRAGATGKSLAPVAGGTLISGVGTRAMISGYGIPVVILSFGKNSYGGVDASGNQRPAPPAANVDETTNYDAAARTAAAPAFVSRISKDADTVCVDSPAAGPLCEFDDIVVWISTPVLVSKLIQANRLP